MPSLAKSFFGYEDSESVKCVELTHIKDAPDCSAVDGSILSSVYNADTGVLSIDVLKAYMPAVGSEPVVDIQAPEYGSVEKAEDSSAIKYTISGLKTIMDTVEGSGTESIAISVSSKDKSIGCDFKRSYELDFSKIKTVKYNIAEKIVLEYIGKPQYLGISLDNGVKWFIDGKEDTASAGSKELDIKDSRLALLTGKVDVNIYAEFNGVKVNYGTHTIDRNKYSVDISVSNVISGNKLYGNINASTIGTEELNVMLFMDGERLNEDHFEYSDATIGKSLCCVVSKNDLDVFNVDNADEYEISKCITIEDAEIDRDILIRLLDSSDDEDSLTNSMFSIDDRIERIKPLINNNYEDYKNKRKLNLHEENDNLVIGYTETTIPVKVGEIIYFDETFHITTESLTADPIDMKNLAKKEILVIDEEAINYIQDVVTLDAFFGTTSELSLSDDGWIFQQNENMEFSAEKEFSNVITQVQVEIKYLKDNTPRGSKFVIYLMTSDGSKVYKYGLERQTDGTMALYDTDGNIVYMYQEEFYKQMIIMPTTMYEITTIKIVGSNMEHDSIMFKDIVIGNKK